jgi:4-diphosphocytidyl-2-C-methyl-D-erythritol kinase
VPVAASPITARAPAKVNLQLAVGPLRADGYHDLVNVFHAVGLYDEVTATPAERFKITVSGDLAGGVVPTDRTNLAATAAIALAAATGYRGGHPARLAAATSVGPALDRDSPSDRTGAGRRPVEDRVASSGRSAAPGVHLHIRKGIPIAGGMAGGSADAAAALVACNDLWGTNVGRNELVEIAAGIGADVPFALVGGTAVGIGRGDQLTPALVRGTYHWVFALADEGMSTPAVYAECDRIRERAAVPLSVPQAAEELMIALRNGDPAALGNALSNDLEQAALALRPQLRLTLQTGLEHGALGGIVSGSGPTCAFLVADAERALDLAVTLSAAGVCRTVRRATGPVQGARIVVPEPSR